MAYINQKDKAVIANNLKPILKEYGIKGSLSIQNNMKITLTLKSGNIDFFENYSKKNENGRVVKDYMQVNPYYLSSNFEGKSLEFMEKVHDALKSAGYYNNSDAMVDYFDVAYYYGVDIGRWNKPYEYTGQ